MRTLTRAILCALMLAGLGCLATHAGTQPPFSPEYEKKVGEKTVAKVETQYERYKDAETQAKLDAMATEIAAASARPEVTYDVRLIDTEEVNAFSIPGGFIYVTKGLLDEVQSDHELAGVLAHEMAHNCTYDALIQAERNKDLFTGSVAAAIAAILLGAGSQEISTVMVAGEYVRRGVLGGYSIQIERMADHHGAEYVMKTSYNPVGLLTFMERLAAQERREPPRELGVFQTHPLAVERVELLADFLHDSGVEINRRATTSWERPRAEQVKANEQDAALVTLWGEDLFLVLTPGPDHETLMQRAEAIVQVLTDLLADGMEGFEVRLSERDGNPAVVATGEAIVVIYPEDAQAHDLEQAALAGQVKDALRAALRKESLDRLF